MVLEEFRSIPDLELVGRIRAGESQLYELLMRRYNQRLYRTVRSVVTDDLEAEDVLQEAWVRAYEHLDQFSGRAQFATWVTRIAFYEALARNRKNKRWAPLEDQAGEIMPEAVPRLTNVATPETQAIQSQLDQLLQNAIDALPDTYRSVFMLRDVELLSTTETAECLGLSEEAVKTRLHRARALLRRELQARMGPSLTVAHSFLGARCDRIVELVLKRIRA
jgi:RNA polymerase sigma-70 factor, ECF subfamily